MITTISLNPSIDRMVHVDAIQQGKLNRITASNSVAGGKGINVALDVSVLGLDAQCIGFMYTEGAKMFEKRLMLTSTAYNFVWVDGEVRRNMKIYDDSNGVITEFNEPGTAVRKEDLDAMVELVTKHAENSDYMVFSGSMPPGCPDDFYRTLIESVEGLGCRCILDTAGKALREGIKAIPYMVKPNRVEAETITGIPIRSVADAADAARFILDLGIEVVCVSMDSDGAVVADSTGVYYAPAPNEIVRTTVGAGDAMVAGMIYGLMGDYSMKECLARGTAAAAARCALDLHHILDKKVYRDMLETIKVEEL